MIQLYRDGPMITPAELERQWMPPRLAALAAGAGDSGLVGMLANLTKRGFIQATVQPAASGSGRAGQHLYALADSIKLSIMYHTGRAGVPQPVAGRLAEYLLAALRERIIQGATFEDLLEEERMLVYWFDSNACFHHYHLTAEAFAAALQTGWLGYPKPPPLHFAVFEADYLMRRCIETYSEFKPEDARKLSPAPAYSKAGS